MKFIDEKIKETIELELEKSSNSRLLQEFDLLILEMKKFDSFQRTEYSLPMVDTIGRSIYHSLYKNSF